MRWLRAPWMLRCITTNIDNRAAKRGRRTGIWYPMRKRRPNEAHAACGGRPCAGAYGPFCGLFPWAATEPRTAWRHSWRRHATEIVVIQPVPDCQRSCEAETGAATQPPPAHPSCEGPVPSGFWVADCRLKDPYLQSWRVGTTNTEARKCLSRMRDSRSNMP